MAIVTGINCEYNQSLYASIHTSFCGFTAHILLQTCTGQGCARVLMMETKSINTISLITL